MGTQLKRRAAIPEVSDHAVLRWLERAHGLDVKGVKLLIAGKVQNAAELGAVAVVVDKVRFILREHDSAKGRVAVTTTLETGQRRGLGVDYARHARDRGDE